jgi:hypothetical protein
MEHTLSLSVSEEIYESLSKIAEEIGEPPEQLAARWVALCAKSLTSDPLDRLIGSLDSGMPGWSDNHDWYIGQAILESMRDVDHYDSADQS